MCFLFDLRILCQLCKRNPKQIKNIEEILEVILKDGRSIISHKLIRLTGPGENYGSEIWALSLRTKTQAGVEETIQTVVKLIPPSEFIQEVFDTRTTFINEINFYKIIIPTLEKFQIDQGFMEVVEFFPKFCGSRWNVNTETDKLSEDTALVLENLKVAGYKNLDRRIGFDLPTTEVIIQNLAKFHAISLGLKILRPDEFESKVKPNLDTRNFAEITKDRLPKIKERLLKKAGEIQDCQQYLDRIKKNFATLEFLPAREPFATISHNDFWVNNVMLKIDNGTPVNTKIVDFQLCGYGSLAKDIIFFAFTSIQNLVCERHFDALVKLYHGVLVKTLEELKCDVSPFSFDNLQKEIEIEAKSQFIHVAHLLIYILAVKGAVKGLGAITKKDLEEIETDEVFYRKYEFVIKQFVERNWL